MSLLIKTRKRDNKFRFWTTISDGWLTGWLSKSQAIKYLQGREKDRCKDECEEIAAKFPNGYTDMNYKFIFDKEGNERYKKMLDDRLKKYK